MKKMGSKSSAGVSSKRKAFSKTQNNKTQFFGAIGIKKKPSNSMLKKFDKDSQQSSTGNESSVYTTARPVNLMIDKTILRSSNRPTERMTPSEATLQVGVFSPDPHTRFIPSENKERLGNSSILSDGP